jgi:DNA (cytosine-5)-methyltransferase 1
MTRRRLAARKRPTHTYALVDLFAGCGGLSLGLELAGFEPVFVNELDPAAMETYLRNRRSRFPGLSEARRTAYDIFEVTSDEGELGGLATHLRRALGGKDIDLVAGGPPCQGYSGIGHRRTFTDLKKEDIPSNHLYREMAKFIRALRPKLFLFENVKGLLSGRWAPGGQRGEIWSDVRATFEDIAGYEIRSAIVEAKAYGVPQNRPRVLLVGVRSDVGWRPTPGKIADGLLPEPEGCAPDPVDFLGDLVDPEYDTKGATETYPTDAMNEVQRWYRCDHDLGWVYPRGARLTEQDYSRHEPRIVEKFRYMIEHGGEIRPEDRTKKFAQRVIPARWGAAGPTITATSLPDDYVHFSQPRIPTVREWARLQTFPDWYQFAGKRTTGGRRRAGDPGVGNWTREVPKYTQIGNAVPVWLAQKVGSHLVRLLD